MASRIITLELDELDWDTIQREFAKRQVRCRDEHGVILPDGDSDLAGALLAECVRDLEDYRELWEAENGK